MKKKVVYFKGDVIYRTRTESGMDTKMLWGVELIGVRETITYLDEDYGILFYRPFMNHFKNFWYKIKMIFKWKMSQ